MNTAIEPVAQQLQFTGSSHRIDNPRQNKSRLHVFVEGENVLENLENRFTRPHHQYKQLVAPILEALGVKARWSQKAGCSCGCSPAFILDRVIHLDPTRSWVGHDLYITIKGAPKNDGTKREIFR